MKKYFLKLKKFLDRLELLEKISIAFIYPGNSSFQKYLQAQGDKRIIAFIFCCLLQYYKRHMYGLILEASAEKEQSFLLIFWK
jgi:hypothetical protein